LKVLLSCSAFSKLSLKVLLSCSAVAKPLVILVILIVIYNLLITVHLRCNVVMVPENAVQMDKRV